MAEQKPIDPPEKSLKYIAWSLKEISENLKKLLELQLSKGGKGEELPF